MAVGVTVELFIDGVWTDYTSRVRMADGIRIIRGRPRYGRGWRPTECRLSFNNHDGLFSPRNPASALHGKIGRYTRLRVRFGSDVRFLGEVPEWPVRSQGAGKDVWVPLIAYGRIHRLTSSGTRAEATSAYRYYVSRQTRDAWWPMEEGPIANGLRAIGNGTPLRISRQGVLIEGRAGSLAPWLGPRAVGLPNFVVLQADVSGTSASEWAVDWLYRIGGPRGDGLILTFRTGFEPGTSRYIELRLWGGSVSSPNIAQITYPTINDLVNQATISGDQFIGDTVHHVRLHVAQSGPNIVATGYVDGTQVVSGSFAGTLSNLTRAGVWVLEEAAGTSGFALSTPVSIGHMVAYGSTIPSLTSVMDAVLGHQGEQAHERFVRLVGESGFTGSSTAGTSTQLGPQPFGPRLNAILDAVEADGGYLLDDRDGLLIEYRALSQITGRPAAIADYAQRQVFDLVLDERQDVVNAVTVQRRDGGEATYRVTDGPLGTSTVGTMAEQVTLGLHSDDQAEQHAAWRANVSTWDEPAISRAAFDITWLQAAGYTTLASNLAAVDVGDGLRIANPPKWAGTVSIDMLIDGYQETIESHRRVIEFYGRPAAPWKVGIYATDAATETSEPSRYDTAGCVTASNFTAPSGTSLSVTTTSGPSWTTSSADWPFLIVVAGVVMRVNSVSGSGASQTLSVTVLSNVSKTIPSGTAVTLFRPVFYGL